MRESVRDQTKKALDAYAKAPRVEWVQQWPGQVVISVGQTYWTSGVHKALQSGPVALSAYCDQLESELQDIVALVRGKVPKQVRKTLSALVTLDVHARDVTIELNKNQVGAGAESHRIKFSLAWGSRYHRIVTSSGCVSYATTGRTTTCLFV